MSQYGFFFDQSRCTGCRTCSVACKNWHDLPPGPLKYLKVYEYEKGGFPDLRIHLQWVPCYHCEKPACVESCPTEAMYKEAAHGAVLIDEDKCVGCRLCYESCPYGAPVFGSDEEGIVAQKCDMCIDRLEQGEKPVCVLACPARALDFDLLDTLIAMYGKRRDLEDMPDSAITGPSVVFKPHSPKRQLVPYDAERARELLSGRDSVPRTVVQPVDTTSTAKGTVGRCELALKHGTNADLMRCTRNDEG
jgi:anaerobic dimethyl sulfoxide reductase subunit B